MTVSRALNDKDNVDEDTKLKILETAKLMGYKPNHIARSLTTRRTYTIGLVLPKISHSFFASALMGIEEATYLKEYQLILAHSSEDAKREIKVIESLESKRVDGLLISSAQSVKNLSQYQDLIENNYPVVFFDRRVPGLNVNSVRTNDEEISREMVEHLILKHHYKKIAHIKGPEHVSIGADRLNGYKKAMKAHGLPIDKNWMIGTELNEKSGYESMKHLLDLPEKIRPEAVFAITDSVAMGAMEAIYEQNLRIPDDIAVVGYNDDKQDNLLNPPLTTVHQPAYEMGKRAAQVLIDIIEGKSQAIEEIVIKSHLVIRKSCGCK